MTLRMLGNRVLVRPIWPKRAMPGGLIAPDVAEYEVPVTGEVVNVSPAARHPDYPDPQALQGKVVTFGPADGHGVVFEGVEYIMLQVDNLLGVIEGETI